MPRFFFSLHDDMVSFDEEGMDLSDRDAAHAHAVRSALAIASAEVGEGHLHLNHRVEVTDAFGELLETVWFREVVEVRDQASHLPGTLAANGRIRQRT